MWHAGLRVIDISDIRRPRTVGAYDYHPPFPEPTHTVLRVPFPVAGRQIAVAVDEEHDHTPGQLHAGLWVFDVERSRRHQAAGDVPGERAGLALECRAAASAPTSSRSTCPIRCVYATWFSGGLRIVDIADPRCRARSGTSFPQPAAGIASPQSNDVDVDQRGLIYLLDRDQGLDILEYTGPR